MGLRFTETNKWKDDWFLSLPNDKRIVWLWLVDNCSIAGLWKKSFTLLNLFCKTDITEPDFKKTFEGRVFEVSKTDFYFIPKFLKIQYPSGLNSKKPLILAVRKEIELNNLTLIISESLGNHYLMIGESLPNDSSIIKDMGMDMGKEKGKRKKEKKEEGEKKEVKVLDHLFKDSEFFDFNKFEIALQEDEKYIPFDFQYYYETVKNWSAQGKMKKDWIATVKNWMLRDLRENKPKLKTQYQHKFNGQQRKGVTEESLNNAINEFYAKHPPK